MTMVFFFFFPPNFVIKKIDNFFPKTFSKISWIYIEEGFLFLPPPFFLEKKIFHPIFFKYFVKFD
jgi:hypothetical protein